MTLSGATSLIVAASELALVRSITSAIKPNAAAPQNPLPKLKFNSEPKFEPRPVIHPAPRLAPPEPPLHTRRVEVSAGIDYSRPSTDPLSQPIQATKTDSPIQPPWAVQTYKPEPAGPDQKVVKVNLIRTDTYHRGAMIDFFC